MTSACLNLIFENNTGLPDDQVFVSFQNPSLGDNNFNVSYQEASSDKLEPLFLEKQIKFEHPGDIMSVPVNLEAIKSSGLAVTELSGGIVFVSYGKALASRAKVPSYIGVGGTDYDTAYQPFELTRVGGIGDQGDMTAINYFTAPIGIKSYQGGVSGTLLQSVAYSQSAAIIGHKLGALTDDSPASVIKDQDGTTIRYIGPSSYGPTDTNPFPSLVAYLQSVCAANQQTQIVNSNAFNVPATGGSGSTNYNFTLDLTATAGSDGSISMTGSIKTTITPYGEAAQPGQTFDNCTVAISASDPNVFNFTLYGQALSSAVTFGAGWSDLQTYMQSVNLGNQGAYATTQNLAIGEISSGVLMGFVNSSCVPAGKSTELKDMESHQWWELDPMIAFNSVQPDHPYYNTYANILYQASSNQVYSIPYSDRMGTGPLVNSVQYNGADVDTWVITLDPPVSMSGD
ncbi:hypothetical protein [Labrenzia sp. CE80]|uniref:hypothetical protein n=1 Tax=Labrenzia sp. CE80 TaxID=1788986 RepID=UPI00129B1A9A|nr:hypothetical protein [Labrenzia sp. CE80]